MPSRVRYSRELLTSLAAEATSLDELLQALGADPDRWRRKYLRQRLNAFAIDTSHFRATGSIYTRELLEDAVAASSSVAGVVRHLQLRQAGGTQAHIGRRIKHFGIDTSHFTGQAHSRGKSFPSRLSAGEVLVRRAPGANRIPGSRLRRALLELGRDDVCADCGISPIWRGRALTLEVDHINGDWSDNHADNLRLLCPNCHAVTDTYCGRNHRSSSRRSGQSV
ncbi:HNH endonuclease signature motif containing protein [Kitasatospora mediocidica]|uniref:HNH endonuclease signature motif containing protein n=1 Tax=Kitasatospora mediocidica TaxID=58352 RepID=UPI0005646178|nr:HNH endonuclease signature motif containing protein [Kitasatospora mediocidica]